MKHTVETKIGSNTLIIETGEIAKQASGSVMVRYGDTMVFAAVTAGEWWWPTRSAGRKVALFVLTMLPQLWLILQSILSIIFLIV